MVNGACGCCSWKLGTERAESWWKKAEESAGLVQAGAENDASNSLGVRGIIKQ